MVVRHVRAHVAAENRKHMTEKIKFHTGKAMNKTDELAKLGAGMYKARGAYWLASEVQDERWVCAPFSRWKR